MFWICILFCSNFKSCFLVFLQFVTKFGPFLASKTICSKLTSNFIGFQAIHTVLEYSVVYVSTIQVAADQCDWKIRHRAERRWRIPVDCSFHYHFIVRFIQSQYSQRTISIDFVWSRQLSRTVGEFIIGSTCAEKRRCSTTRQPKRSFDSISKPHRWIGAGRQQRRTSHHWLWIVAAGLPSELWYIATVSGFIWGHRAEASSIDAWSTHWSWSDSELWNSRPIVYGKLPSTGTQTTATCKVGLLRLAILFQWSRCVDRRMPARSESGE